MTTIHQLTWNNHYIGLAANFSSRTKELIRATIGYDIFPLEAYQSELDIKILPAHLEELKHLQALKSFNIRNVKGDLHSFPYAIPHLNIYPAYDFDLTPEERLNDFTFKYWLSYIYQQDIQHDYCLPLDSFPEELTEHIGCSLERSMVLTMDYSVANKILTISLSNFAGKYNPLVVSVNLTVDQMVNANQAKALIEESISNITKEFFTKDKEMYKTLS